jgi:DNA repair protein RadC
MRCRIICTRRWRIRRSKIRVLFLNAKNKRIANKAMWRGSVDEASMHVRDVMKRAMAHGATAIIIVHNHPSGNPAPSQADVKLTRELVEAGRHMKVAVHDHVIVGVQDSRAYARWD